MDFDDEQVYQNALAYAKHKQQKVLRQDSLGHGTEGWVWKISVPSAVKAFYRHDRYETELSCYRRLLEHRVDTIHGLNVPVLEGFDDHLRVIEISFVQPPYLLDFGKACLDEPPRYFQDEKQLAIFRAQWQAEFGTRWPDVNAVLYTLQEKYGIYYLDPRPANINFGDHDEDDDWLKEPTIDYTDYE